MEASIYTDGSSLGNPGPGGFCAIIERGNEKIIVKGGDSHTTNNRMELSAVIAGLHSVHKKFPEDKTCTIVSDSKLIIETVTKGWKRKKNTDLWAKFDAIQEKFSKINWKWVKGHNGHKQNTEADYVAVKEAEKRRRLI